MLSDELAGLSETVLADDDLPAEKRCLLALLLADAAERVRPMEDAPVPATKRGAPDGCVDLAAERTRRCSAGAGWTR